VQGILADANISSPVDDLVREMQKEPWAEFWNHLGLALFHFDDVGLTPTSTDLEIWQRCQAEQLVLITNNRNEDSPDSLEATFRQHNTPASLPVRGRLNHFGAWSRICRSSSSMTIRDTILAINQRSLSFEARGRY
jgi:predicted nuclease of predicted toxin-antitoxin system